MRTRKYTYPFTHARKHPRRKTRGISTNSCNYGRPSAEHVQRIDWTICQSPWDWVVGHALRGRSFHALVFISLMTHVRPLANYGEGSEASPGTERETDADWEAKPE